MPGGAGTPGGYGGGAGFGGSSSGGGGRTGGGGGGGEGGAAMRAAAQREEVARAAAAAAAAEQARTDALNAQRARAANDARENAIQLAALTPKTIEPVRSPHRDTPLQVLEQQILDTTKPTTPDILPEFEKRGITTITGGSPHTEGPIDRIVYQPTDLPKRTYDPRTDPNALLKRPGGIGTTLKNVALGVLAPQLLAGTALAKPYNLYRQYQTAKRFIPKGAQETIRTAFKPRLTTGTKRKTTPLVAKGGDGQRVKTVAERVATGQGLESGAKLLGIQNTRNAELFKRRSTVEDILRKGSYQGRDLTSGQKNNLRNYIEQINKFLVPVQQGI